MELVTRNAIKHNKKNKKKIWQPKTETKTKQSHHVDWFKIRLFFLQLSVVLHAKYLNSPVCYSTPLFFVFFLKTC